MFKYTQSKLIITTIVRRIVNLIYFPSRKKKYIYIYNIHEVVYKNSSFKTFIVERFQLF